MNVLGFVAFAGGFGFVMWTLSRLMVDRNDSPAS
jgi:nitrate reductase NapE component